MTRIVHVGTTFAGSAGGGITLDLTEECKGRPIKTIKSADALLFSNDGGGPDPAVQYPITIVAVTPSGAAEMQLTGPYEVTYQSTADFDDWLLILDVEFLYPRAGRG